MLGQMQKLMLLTYEALMRLATEPRSSHLLGGLLQYFGFAKANKQVVLAFLMLSCTAAGLGQF